MTVTQLLSGISVGDSYEEERDSSLSSFDTMGKCWIFIDLVLRLI